MFKRRTKNRYKTRSKPKKLLVRANIYEVTKLGLVIGLSAVILYGMNMAKKVPVERVEIRSELRNVKPEEIKEKVSRFIQAGFFQMEINQLEDSIEHISWVYHAHVKRAWPDRLVISIQEQQPVFTWGKNQLLNRYGGRFDVENREAFQQLPHLSGQPGREVYLAQLYLQYQPLFKRQGLLLKSIEEDERHNKIFTLADGVRIEVGDEDVEQRLDRYLQVNERLFETSKKKIVGVDLRHTNGIAIQWDS